MAAPDCTELLSGLLSIERGRAEALLSRFSAAVASSLLERGSVSVRGLGSFSIRYTPPERRAGEEGWVYAPPSNAIAWRRRGGTDETPEMLRRRLRMEPDEARRAAAAFAKAFRAAMRGREGLVLPGFGRFGSAGKRSLGFRPEPGLLELANGDYHGLASISMAAPVRRRRSALAGALLLVLVSFGAGFLSVRFGAVGGFPDPLRPALPPPAAMAPAPPAPVPPPAPPEQGVLLEEGEFTIVLATFSQRGTALREQARLDSSGLRSALWPAWQDGRKYWRLRTGRYALRSEAVGAMRSMPHPIAGGAYIQKVIKRVVSNAEKEL